MTSEGQGRDCATCGEASCFGAFVTRTLNHSEVIYQPGELVCRAGMPALGFHVLVEGLAGIRRADPAGRSSLVALARHGEVLGTPPLEKPALQLSNVVALTRCTVCFLERDTALGILGREPLLARALWARESRRVADREQALAMAHGLAARARVAQLLLELRDEFATVRDDGSMRLELPLSRRDMGELLGMRPETVARAIRALESSDVATFTGRTVVIRDLDALFDEVELVG